MILEVAGVRGVFYEIWITNLLAASTSGNKAKCGRHRFNTIFVRAQPHSWCDLQFDKSLRAAESAAKARL
jgi:hypothetical protein